MSSTLICGARLVNEGTIRDTDLLIIDDRIARIEPAISPGLADTVIEAAGRYLLPGMIDDQVHFREPGLTHKGDFAHESRAAVLGGVTSFMEMPNSQPPTVSRKRVLEKQALLARASVANWSCYLGATNDNLDEVRAIDPTLVAGIKVFMGSSTGNMLVDDPAVLAGIFRDAPCLIATHCEDTPTITAHQAAAHARFGEDIPADQHPLIRSREACLTSSRLAIALAREHDARLHVLHLTTAEELDQFTPGHATDKRITAEVCVHHLWYSRDDYHWAGHRIKCNPAIKEASDRAALRAALVEGRIDVIATDHAPHTWNEKQAPYTRAPAGIPLVQHALPMLATLCQEGVFTLPFIVEKYAHNPARLYQVAERGFLREGYFADCCLLDTQKPLQVERASLASKCGWSPFDGQELAATVTHCWVNGALQVDNGHLVAHPQAGRPLHFARPNVRR